MKFFLSILIVLLSFLCFAQGETDQQLAQYYYANGDYEKAEMYYERLFTKEPSKINFTRYYDCLIQTKKFKDAEKVIKKQISSNKSDQEYKVMLAVFYEENQEPEKAQKIYDELIENLQIEPNQIIGLYTVFKSKNRTDLAFLTLEKGRKILKDSYPLNFQFAEMYSAKGQTDKMINEYLDLLDINSGYSSSIQTVLSRQIDFSNDSSTEYNQLKSELLARVQKKPNEVAYSEMLIWLFIQKKNFNGALLQVQALDKRLDEQGRRVFELGKMCVENKEYETARKAFKYVTLLGEDKLYYYQAENSLLNTRFLEITSNRSYTQEELTNAISEYQSTINRVGKKKSSLALIIELSHILAFYGNRSEEAMSNLNEALLFPGLTDMQKAEIKMQLADIHVLHGDIWEASLLYMQIETDFKFEPIGHEAKFKNARIFYYDGEFDFAQSQLSVLKESTSKLIANDALQLSLMITDNYGLDSNYRAMVWFSKGDLLIEQHRFNEAFQLFDSLSKEFPYHSLADEILFKKAKAMELQGRWEEAVPLLEELLKYHREDILADDALFELGDLYENHLNDKEKAADYYKTILFDFKGSLHAIESRKRFRAIRGDASITEEDEL